MRSSNKKPNAKQGDNELLWQRIQNGAREENKGDAELRDFDEVSLGVHALLREEAQSSDAAAAFASTHARLMSAIETDAKPKTSRFQLRLNEFRRNVSTAAWGITALRWAVPALLIIFAGWGGHFLGSSRADADVLPAQSLLDDYKGGLLHPAPMEVRASDAPTTAKWLSRRTGMKVRVPQRADVKLLGGHAHHLKGHEVAQTRYLKNGRRIALYQIHAPSYGLSNLTVAKLDGHTFFLHDNGEFRLIAWRSGESVMALATPFSTADALQLANAIRNSPEMQPNENVN